ncbi:MAG: DUF308 domain-containing protein [Clostridia bacterium]|nr:DUF308 domain-containing protein [Clostridia bacterium]
MKKFKEFLKCVDWLSALASLVLLAVGIILMVFAEGFLLVICYIVGAVMILISITRIVVFIRSPQKDLYDISINIITLVVGALLMAVPSIAITWFVSLMFGMILIVDGGIKLQDSAVMYRAKEKMWWADLVVALVCIILGILIIVNPFPTEGVLLDIVAVSFMFDAVISLAGNIYNAAKGLNAQLTP